MKKKYVLYGIAMLLVICIIVAGFWYFSPKVFLKGIDSGEVASISVFNGSTGQRMTLENPEDIDSIVNNIQSAKMKRGKISSNYDGFVFSLTFKDKEGNVIDKFIINSKNVIRDDPFFYESENSELCFSFLQELENKYFIEE